MEEASPVAAGLSGAPQLSPGAASTLHLAKSNTPARITNHEQYRNLQERMTGRRACVMHVGCGPALIARTGGAWGSKRGTSQPVGRVGFVNEMGTCCRRVSVKIAGGGRGTTAATRSVIACEGRRLLVENFEGGGTLVENFEGGGEGCLVENFEAGTAKGRIF